jgi:hypothetical protein
MTDLTLPTVHLNGTSREHLLTEFGPNSAYFHMQNT